MEYSIGIVIRIVFAIVFAFVMGNGSVVAFNRMPAKWFEDFDEDAFPAGTGEERRKVLPQKLIEADAAGRQRLPSTPWKYAFIGYFAICGLYLAIRGGSTSFEIAVLCVLFVVLEMAVADQLYRIVPDQLSAALAVTAIAFIGYYDKWWEQGAGALLGLVISLAVLLLGYIIFRTGSIGGADIKFFTCMGLVTGRNGILMIYILTTFFFAIYSFVRIAGGRGSIKDKNAMMPSACAAATVYFLFLWNFADLLV